VTKEKQFDSTNRLSGWPPPAPGEEHVTEVPPLNMHGPGINEERKRRNEGNHIDFHRWKLSMSFLL
jgi:hypothetical protein